MEDDIKKEKRKDDGGSKGGVLEAGALEGATADRVISAESEIAVQQDRSPATYNVDGILATEKTYITLTEKAIKPTESIRKHGREKANMINVKVTFQQEARPLRTPEITATLTVEKPAPVPGTS